MTDLTKTNLTPRQRVASFVMQMAIMGGVILVLILGILIVVEALSLTD